jgi:hypothetical protein
MPKTERTTCKFFVKEDAEGGTFLSLEFLGSLPDDVLMLNEANLCFNFRQPMSYEDAQAFAKELNAHR